MRGAAVAVCIIRADAIPMTIEPGRARWLAVVLLLLSVCSPVRSENEGAEKKGTFVRVATPSSIVVRRFNREYFFDLLGIQPVMSLEPTDSLEKEARRYLGSVLEGQSVILKQEEGREGQAGPRTYAGYVYLEDGTCLNEQMLSLGYGTVDAQAPFSRLEAFRLLEEEARTQKRGLWKNRRAPFDPREATTCTDGSIAYAGICGVSNPEILPDSKIVPDYPGRARRKKIEGRVVLMSIVSKDGSVRVVQTLKSPDDQLSQAAIAAVEQWRYRPALKDGEPVDAYFTIVVEFLLARGGL